MQVYRYVNMKEKEENIKLMFAKLHEMRESLTEWQLNFFHSVKKQYRKKQFISERQMQILQDIIKFTP